MLYRAVDFKYTIYAVGQCNCRCDECHSIFGPYIGAIPSALLIFLADPVKGVYFVIFIILLQQFDGNILGPKILGNSTGLSAFWVVFSILIAGGLFGIPGMLLGVPTFAVIYYIISMVVNRKLRKSSFLQIPTAMMSRDMYRQTDLMYIWRKIY